MSSSARLELGKLLALHPIAMLSVLVMRHGEAESPGAGEDATRALTPLGVASLTQAARGGLALGLSITRIYHSPLVRTRQTAEIWQGITGGVLESLEALRPGATPERVAQALEGASKSVSAADARTQSVLLVGHMPDVSYLVGYFVAPDAPGVVAFAPGTLACVEFPLRPRAAAGSLRWVLTVEQLGRLGAAAPLTAPRSPLG